MSKPEVETFASVWDVLADTPEEAANLSCAVRRSMRQIAAILYESNGWTQAEAAERCGVTQPRINDSAARAPVAVLARCAGEYRRGTGAEDYVKVE